MSKKLVSGSDAKVTRGGASAPRTLSSVAQDPVAGKALQASAVIGSQTLAGRLTERVYDLTNSTSRLESVLMTLGVLESVPTAGTDDKAVHPHNNVLAILNENLGDSLRYLDRVTFKAVYGNADAMNDEELTDEDGDTKKVAQEEPVIASTAFGREVHRSARTNLGYLEIYVERVYRVRSSLLGDSSGSLANDRVEDSGVAQCIESVLTRLSNAQSVIETLIDELNYNLLGGVQ